MPLHSGLWGRVKQPWGWKDSLCRLITWMGGTPKHCHYLFSKGEKISTVHSERIVFFFCGGRWMGEETRRCNNLGTGWLAFSLDGKPLTPLPEAKKEGGTPGCWTQWTTSSVKPKGGDPGLPHLNAHKRGAGRGRRGFVRILGLIPGGLEAADIK